MTVPAAERIGVLPRNAPLEAFQNAFDHALHMVGMVHFLPAPASYFFQGRPGVVEPALVEPVSRAARIGGPSTLAYVVGELAKSRLARGQRGHGAFAFGNLLGNHINADD